MCEKQQGVTLLCGRECTCSIPLQGDNQLLVTEEQLELKYKWLKSSTSGKLPVVLEEFPGYIPIYKEKTKRRKHVSGWT